MEEIADDFDTVLDLCQDRYRRIVLAVLVEEQRLLTVNDLTKTVLNHNHQTSIIEGSIGRLTKIKLSLLHTHIPKLEMEGVIEYDRERQKVKPTEQLDQLQPYLSAIINLDPDLEEPVGL